MRGASSKAGPQSIERRAAAVGENARGPAPSRDGPARGAAIPARARRDHQDTTSRADTAIGVYGGRFATSLKAVS